MPRRRPGFWATTTAVAAGAANVVARATAGIRTSIVLQLRTQVRSGIRISSSLALRIRQTAGFRATTYVLGMLLTPARTGLRLSTLLDTRARVNGAARITRTKIDLAARWGATTQAIADVATQIGGQAWQNPANSLGQVNGTLTTKAGQATGSDQRRITWTFQAPANKTPLTITTVGIRIYDKIAGSTQGNAKTLYEISTNAGTSWATLDATYNGDPALPANNDHDHLVAGRLIDITALVGGSWTTVGQVQVRCLGTTGLLSAAATISIDAVELTIAATRTDTF